MPKKQKTGAYFSAGLCCPKVVGNQLPANATQTCKSAPAVDEPIWSTSTVKTSPAENEVTSGVFTPVAVPEMAIVGRFACVVKIVVPPLFTSTINVAPVGAVNTAAVTPMISPSQGATQRILFAAAVMVPDACPHIVACPTTPGFAAIFPPENSLFGKNHHRKVAL
jgi:hypothetical protein